MDPALALPSYRGYRGSLLALLAGTVFAVWLLVRPPQTTDADGPVPAPLAGVILTATATQAPDETAAVVTATPTPTQTPTPTPVPEATAAPAVEPRLREHTISEGDTLISIAVLYLPQGKNVRMFVEEIAALNELADVNSIVLGQVIRIPSE
jgi:nucleoid-associated protein YgaU